MMIESYLSEKGHRVEVGAWAPWLEARRAFLPVAKESEEKGMTASERDIIMSLIR